MIQLKY